MATDQLQFLRTILGAARSARLPEDVRFTLQLEVGLADAEKWAVAYTALASAGLGTELTLKVNARTCHLTIAASDPLLDSVFGGSAS